MMYSKNDSVNDMNYYINKFTAMQKVSKISQMKEQTAITNINLMRDLKKNVDYENGYNEYSIDVKVEPEVEKSEPQKGVKYRSLEQVDVAKEYPVEVKVEPVAINADLQKAKDYRTLGQIDIAKAYYEKAYKQDPKDSNIVLSYAIFYWGLGEYTNAVLKCDEVFQLNPADKSIITEALFIRECCLKKLAETEPPKVVKSAESFDALTPLKPEDIPVFTYQEVEFTNILPVQEDIPKFTPPSEEVIHIAKPSITEDVSKYISQAEDYAKKEDYENAIKLFTTAINIDSGRADLYEGRGRAYYSIDKKELALTDLDKACKLDPKNESALLGCAIILAETKQFSKALLKCNELIQLHPTDKDLENFVMELHDQCVTESIFYHDLAMQK